MIKIKENNSFTLWQLNCSDINRHCPKSNDLANPFCYEWWDKRDSLFGEPWVYIQELDYTKLK